MEEYSWLGNLGLAKVFVCTFEHNICDAVSEDIVSFFKQFSSQFRVFIQIFAHSNELGTLTWEYKCFHNAFFYLKFWQRYYLFSKYKLFFTGN